MKKLLWILLIIIILLILGRFGYISLLNHRQTAFAQKILQIFNIGPYPTGALPMPKDIEPMRF